MLLAPCPITPEYIRSLTMADVEAEYHCSESGETLTVIRGADLVEHMQWVSRHLDAALLMTLRARDTMGDILNLPGETGTIEEKPVNVTYKYIDHADYTECFTVAVIHRDGQVFNEVLGVQGFPPGHRPYVVVPPQRFDWHQGPTVSKSLL